LEQGPAAHSSHNPATILPTVDGLGFYPTIEGVSVQGALIVAAVIVWLYNRRQHAVIAKQQANAHVQA
jgi:prolipoprotein diacylglyceryltransferase